MSDDDKARELAHAFLGGDYCTDEQHANAGRSCYARSSKLVTAIAAALRDARAEGRREGELDERAWCLSIIEAHTDDGECTLYEDIERDIHRGRPLAIRALPIATQATTGPSTRRPARVCPPCWADGDQCDERPLCMSPGTDAREETSKP